METDRRIRRSEQTAVALELLLSSRRARHDLDALVIADAVGFAVAASSASQVDADEIAAMLPLLDRGRTLEGLTVSCFTFAGQTLFVGAVGSSRELESELRDTARSVRRILSERRAVA